MLTTRRTGGKQYYAKKIGYSEPLGSFDTLAAFGELEAVRVDWSWTTSGGVESAPVAFDVYRAAQSTGDPATIPASGSGLWTYIKTVPAQPFSPYFGAATSTGTCYDAGATGYTQRYWYLINPIGTDGTARSLGVMYWEFSAISPYAASYTLQSSTANTEYSQDFTGNIASGGQKDFVLSQTARESTLRVHVNGLRVRPPGDFTFDGDKTITFVRTIDENEAVVIDYYAS